MFPNQVLLKHATAIDKAVRTLVLAGEGTIARELKRSFEALSDDYESTLRGAAGQSEVDAAHLEFVP